MEALRGIVKATGRPRVSHGPAMDPDDWVIVRAIWPRAGHGTATDPGRTVAAFRRLSSGPKADDYK